MEKRIYPRFSVQKGVRAVLTGVDKIIYPIDVSRTGAFLEGHLLPENGEAEVCFITDDAAVQRKCIVPSGRTNEHGSGIRFQVPLSGAELTRLAGAVKPYLPPAHTQAPGVEVSPELVKTDAFRRRIFLNN